MLDNKLIENALALTEIEKFSFINGNHNYIISSFGKVISMNYSDRGYGKELKPQIRGKGYQFFLIEGEKISLHRLVGIYFIPNPENKPYINHIDGNKLNCRESNLEWVTGKENCQHAHDIGLNPVTVNNTYLSNHPDKGKFYGDSKSSKAVLVYNLNGKFLCEYSSCREASEKTGAHRSGISQCCSGKLKSAKGFIFKMKNL